ncbi:energy transducer TonB [Magnetospirillum fulvum]|nr:TonB family protein [Magnetospirillum fulvum]
MKSDRSGWGRRRFGAAMLLSLAGHGAVLGWIAAASPVPAQPSQGDPAIVSVVELIPPPIAPVAPSPPPEVRSPPPVASDPAVVPPRPRRAAAAAPQAKAAPPPVAVGAEAVPMEAKENVSEAALTANAPSSGTTSVAAEPGEDETARRYAETVWRHLLAHRPRGLRLKGSVVLAFTLSRQGAVIQAAIARSSGAETLDQAVLEGLAAAAPFPAPPAVIGDAGLSFTVPVQVR